MCLTTRALPSIAALALIATTPVAALRSPELSAQQQQMLRENFALSVDKLKGPYTENMCVCPDGRTLPLTVNDEKGSATPEGDVRVFAGLRSDPFYLAWDVAALETLPNLLQHTNVLCLVVEFETRRVLDPAAGSLFGAIAETVPISRQRTLLGPPVLRVDWVGRPEQTNMRLPSLSVTISSRYASSAPHSAKGVSCR